ncbi:LysM peptidoglycan-binding domain-containing protein [Vibrio lentus]|uniref:LysM domain-containing protein n=1 Tax=Vibrio lentus TaxID=136468 RepID=A0AB36XJ91_9VIBR|nr:LysM peptidoglycan-binding domain-containing protein [Vibrio lentus]PMI12093.1 hypothetical protein BCU51_25615 [Vibrio lentus]PMK41626.1 hypothetical protein BCT99_26030 [Vibrio lentus]PMM43212.1 hypothetical protein BCT56_22655 [Vibrio lentus]
MNKNGLFWLLALAPATLYAQSDLTQSNTTFTEYSPFQISAGLTASVFDDTKRDSESFGYKAMLGYRADDNVLLEFGYADFTLTDDSVADLSPALFELSLLHPLSDYASLYLGGGGAFNDDIRSLTAKLGLLYQINRNWYADVGYQGIFDVEPYNDDLYSFNFMVGYRFSHESQKSRNVTLRPTAPPTPVVDVIKTEPPVSVAPIVAPPPKMFVEIEGREVCDIQYEVQPGDYLHKIAGNHQMSLAELLALNPKFGHRNIDLIYPGEVMTITTLVVPGNC